MMTSRAATRGPPNLSSCSSYNPTRNKLTIMGSSFLNNPCFLLSSNIAKLQKFVPAQASNSQGGGGGGGGGGGEGEETPSLNGTTSGTSQEDWNYLLKLGAGSLAGAAVIKYGSILFPEITRPNILQALIMISTPVVVAVVLLIKLSYQE
nr:unknown [Populus trichocarpa]